MVSIARGPDRKEGGVNELSRSPDLPAPGQPDLAAFIVQVGGYQPTTLTHETVPVSLSKVPCPGDPMLEAASPRVVCIDCAPDQGLVSSIGRPHAPASLASHFTAIHPESPSSARLSAARYYPYPCFLGS